jgi:hypothetical protein
METKHEEMTATGAQVGAEVHHGECKGGGGGCCVPGAPSGRLGDRVCELAGSEVDEGAGGRANMMRPRGEALKIYLHRVPIDMRKYVLTIVMRFRSMLH